ncbi:50S ribosomal protein L3 [Candidatus Viridilinea mediisalina]|uniref:Large ribosomal subunit protein uL3 n=1 Tax=Candidatus Viridilinea mediisalina TaxID=2024553 RepID=A0A2A6RMW6_9CHLR|nr:50S ribosomal protein L3 [Candidatus Viridilinea mediisalina]PDW04209.1 50S ribosomal protein L3 [Candidatus Viridilinea mediisalina]
MVHGMLGRKVGMMQVFTPKGEVVPVTVINAGPCVVTQVRVAERDGYDAVQLGFEQVPARKLTKPQQGHLKGAGTLVRILREFSADNPQEHTVGDVINADLFAAGQKVDVSANSKGRGFAGVVKRHGFRGGPKTHGQSDRHRAPGSIGAGTAPGRVWKGQKMAGRMGGKRVTVQNLEVVEVLPEKNLILVKGSVPGARNGLVQIRKAVKG